MTTPTREAIALNRAVAAQIRSVLTWRRMRQSVLAKQLGVTEVWLSRRLREVQPLSLDDVERICQALRIEPAELIAAAVKGAWQTTPEKVPGADRPRDTRPNSRPDRPHSNGPGRGRTRRIGDPPAVALPPRAA